MFAALAGGTESYAFAPRHLKDPAPFTRQADQQCGFMEILDADQCDLCTPPERNSARRQLADRRKDETVYIYSCPQPGRDRVFTANKKSRYIIDIVRPSGAGGVQK
jgi:hypothetical protein